MRTMALVGLLAMVLVWPLSSCAQTSNSNNTAANNNDLGGWQLRDPNAYTQEDSHPIRAIASLLSPVGWALEWGVARPWHYVATQTFLAPVLNGGQQDDSWSEYYGNPGPQTQVPIDQLTARQPAASGYYAPAPQPLREQNLGAPSASTGSSSSTTGSSYQSYSAPGAYPAAGGGTNQPPSSSSTQPALH